MRLAVLCVCAFLACFGAIPTAAVFSPLGCAVVSFTGDCYAGFAGDMVGYTKWCTSIHTASTYATVRDGKLARVYKETVNAPKTLHIASSTAKGFLSQLKQRLEGMLPAEMCRFFKGLKWRGGQDFYADLNQMHVNFFAKTDCDSTEESNVKALASQATQTAEFIHESAEEYFGAQRKSLGTAMDEVVLVFVCRFSEADAVFDHYEGFHPELYLCSAVPSSVAVYIESKIVTKSDTSDNDTVLKFFYEKNKKKICQTKSKPSSSLAESGLKTCLEDKNFELEDRESFDNLVVTPVTSQSQLSSSRGSQLSLSKGSLKLQKKKSEKNLQQLDQLNL